MPLTRAKVDAVFQALLGRRPESEATYRWGMAYPRLSAFVLDVARSEEFRQRSLHHTSRPAAMLPHGQERIVFLHVPKCGGTTLHDLLAGWFGAGTMHPERHNALWRHPAGHLAEKRVFSGHYDYYSTQLIPGRRRLITVLRDPRERLVSLYNFLHAHLDAVIDGQGLALARRAADLDIAAFFADPWVRSHPCIDNAMSRTLSDVPQGWVRWEGPTPQGPSEDLDRMAGQALANLMAFDFVGFLSDMDGSVARLADLLGRPVPPRVARAQALNDIAATNPNLRAMPRQTLSADTAALLDDLVRRDDILYHAARAKFEPPARKEPVP